MNTVVQESVAAGGATTIGLQWPVKEQLADNLSMRLEYGSTAGWRLAVDSINPLAAWDYLQNPDPNYGRPHMAFGYPVVWGQGEVLADGKRAGWTPDDFSEFEHAGVGVARIANLTPNWKDCSIGDVEAGALTYAAGRTFSQGRRGFRPGTSTLYASLFNWSAVGKACRGAEPEWAFVADWDQYPSAQEVAMIESQLAAVCPGTKLGLIQFRSDVRRDVDLSVIVNPRWGVRA